MTEEAGAWRREPRARRPRHFIETLEHYQVGQLGDTHPVVHQNVFAGIE